MAFAETARRIAGTLLAMLQTRLELATVELEEEARRLMGYAAMGLAALFLSGVAVVLAAFFVVLLFWDSYRLQAVGGLALLFGVAGAALALKLKSSFAGKPRLLASTVDELKKDYHSVRGHHE